LRRIDTMVAVIHGLQIGETSSVAKTAEQTMAIGGCVLVGTLAGAVVFPISRPQAGRWQSPGIVLGLWGQTGRRDSGLRAKATPEKYPPQKIEDWREAGRFEIDRRLNMPPGGSADDDG
jgi:hypothetical protein